MNVLKKCPVCGEDLAISKLTCANCKLDFSGSFQMSLFENLNDSEIDFVKQFLKNEGNFSRLQEHYGMTYANVKNILKDINIKLGTIEDQRKEIDMEVIAQKNQTGIIKVIQDKFIECGGKSKMQMLKGDPLDIWVASSGEGVLNSGYKNLVCEWYILEAIVKKANELGGIMYRGDSAAQNGAKIGSPELPLDTIDAYIALNFYGAYEGASTIRRSTYYSAILAWAGIVENHRSKGKGGYIVVKPEFRD